MRIGYTEEQEALRQSSGATTPKCSRPTWSGPRHQFGHRPTVRRLVRRWPPTAGSGSGGRPSTGAGQVGDGAVHLLRRVDARRRSRADAHHQHRRPTLMDFGTEEQKAEFLPRILAGEIHFCIGYTEPNAGTDLASLTTKAVRDGDEYVINGARSTRAWPAVRTTSGWPRAPIRGLQAQGHLDVHRADGHTGHPGRAHAPHGHAQHQLHLLRDVRVPAANLVVARTMVGRSSRTSSTTSGHPVLAGHHRPLPRRRAGVGAVDQAARRAPVIDQQWSKSTRRVRAELEYLRLINWKVAWQATQGRLDVADASSIKVFGTEFYLRAFRLLMEVNRTGRLPPAGLAGAVLAGRLECTPLDDHPHFGGGPTRSSGT